MKAVILAGGLGTRLSEETLLRPKPMIEIGGKPILWHIMKTYHYHNVTDFIICCGYKGYMIKEYFANYLMHVSDLTFDMVDNNIVVHQQHSESWRVTLVDTGENSMTGGRLKRVKSYIAQDEVFFFTYGDGVSDIDISEQLKFHRSHQKLASVAAVQPPGRYGSLVRDNNRIVGFQEKPAGDGGWINGGYFILSPKVLDLIDDDHTSWEGKPMEVLASQGELMAFEHRGFWHPMDTLRDRNYLEELWSSGAAPWKKW